MNCYWWRGNSNFGDELSPLLLQHFAGLTTKWSTPARAECVSTGSVLDALPQAKWNGIVAGSGKLHSRTRTDLTGAIVLGLRGRLTADDVILRRQDRRNLVLGDPALLADEWAPTERGKYPLGLIAHWSDTDRVLFHKYAHLNPLEIHATDHPQSVLAQIGSCERIITSSLHGAIVADAYGMPRLIEPFPRMEHPWEGGDFKFRDMSSVIGLPLRWGEWQTASTLRIEQIQSDLFGMFQLLARTIHAS